ncbi:hypothetical protein HPB49_017865 [Dermacentor silvarum]|uniref:Uncharacterized protein n=1 Tax=Dermacentor silvarum TaxID=543639 RepID=A0ACB8CSD0_DERSI|nr:hypothetical protein HPB49_017865 [Dermacentor silvarum]
MRYSPDIKRKTTTIIIIVILDVSGHPSIRRARQAGVPTSGEGKEDDDGAMDLILSVMDEGYHLGSAVAALVVIAHTVYLGLDSADEVTNLVQKCLLLHFHVVRLRTLTVYTGATADLQEVQDKANYLTVPKTR